MTRFACVFHVLRALATPKNAYARCIYIISVRTHAGCSIAPDLMQMGACNQRKKTFRAKSMQSGATPPPSVTTGENFQNARLRVSQETGKKKKSPAIGFLVPFYVKHSKGFLSA